MSYYLMMDKIICVGKNYVEHAHEMAEPLPLRPVLFLKPPSSLLALGSDPQIPLQVDLPKGRGVVHPECEMVFRMNEQGVLTDVTLGLDLTLRDVQSQLKKNGHPWELGKVFKNSAVIARWIPLADFKDFMTREFQFFVDGKLRQKAQGNEMRFSPQACAELAQQYFPICAGDLLFTGTPAGVGEVQSGQMGELRWGDQILLKVRFN